MDGKNYCVLTIDWNYELGHVDVSMPKHVPATLNKLLRKPKKSPQCSPHRHKPIQLGQKQQNSYCDKSKHLDDNKATKRMQPIVGSFLHQARALDHSLLPAINETATT